MVLDLSPGDEGEGAEGTGGELGEGDSELSPGGGSGPFEGTGEGDPGLSPGVDPGVSEGSGTGDSGSSVGLGGCPGSSVEPGGPPDSSGSPGDGAGGGIPSPEHCSGKAVTVTVTGGGGSCARTLTAGWASSRAESTSRTYILAGEAVRGKLVSESLLHVWS